MTSMLPRDAEKALADAVRPSDSVTFMPESAITLPVLE
jgi:hypothetical protein